MQFEQFLDGIEYPADHVGLWIACHLLDIEVRDHIEIELRAHPLEDMREPQRGHIAGLIGSKTTSMIVRNTGASWRECSEKPSLITMEAMIGLRERGAEGIFEAADNDGLIDERIDRASQPAPFHAERRPMNRREAGDNEGFEIGTVGCFPPKVGGRRSGMSPSPSSCRIPVTSMLTEGLCRQGLSNSCRKRELSLPHFLLRQLPSMLPSDAGRDTREIPQSRKDQTASPRMSRGPRFAPTLSQHPPDRANRPPVRRVRKKTDRCVSVWTRRIWT